MKARQKGKQAYAITKVYQLSKAIEGLGVRFVGLHPWCLENEEVEEYGTCAAQWFEKRNQSERISGR